MQTLFHQQATLPRRNILTKDMPLGHVLDTLVFSLWYTINFYIFKNFVESTNYVHLESMLWVSLGSAENKIKWWDNKMQKWTIWYLKIAVTWTWHCGKFGKISQGEFLWSYIQYLRNRDICKKKCISIDKISLRLFWDFGWAIYYFSFIIDTPSHHHVCLIA